MSIETLDALRGAWKEMESHIPISMPADNRLARQWKERNNKMLWRFVIELIVYVVIYTGAIIIIANAASGSRQLFGIKIIALSLIFFIPIGISLYRSLSFLRSGDITSAMTDYVEDSIAKLKKSKALYVRYSYLFTLFMIVMLLTDGYFGQQSLLIKTCIFIFVGSTAILVKPAVDMTYGRDIRHFEQIRKEMGER